MSRRVLRVWGAVAMAMVWIGCGSVERLVTDGDYAAAIARAVGSRRPPRGPQARAYAEALVQTDRFDEARAVLLGDFQRGGGLESLTRLADLELGAGLEGTAAVHFGRIADLDVRALRGRQDVCALLRRRADGFARAGAGAAANRDLARADAVCGSPVAVVAQRRLAQTAVRTAVAQRREAELKIAASQCLLEGTTRRCEARPETSAAQQVSAAMADAMAEGPRALRRVAREHQLTLPPSQVVALLAADLRGDLSTELVADDEVRRWVGAAGWSDFAPRVMSLAQGEAAYLRLRLSVILEDLPVAPDKRLGPPQRTVWAAQATGSAGDAAWRIFAWMGDLGAAELAIGTAWRPRGAAADSPRSATQVPGIDAHKAVGEQVDGADAVGGVVRPRHWTSRLPPGERELEATLVVARLRHHRDRPELALQIARYAIARARARGVGGLGAIAARFVGWHLAAGRFAQALAVADAAPQLLAPLSSAAATGMLLSQALCGGPCAQDEDRRVAARVMGEPWLEAAIAELPRLATSAVAPLPSASGCPSVGERLAADGPLARVLASPDRTRPGVTAALSRIVESDLTLGCSARDATWLWVASAPSSTALFVAELLAHEPVVPTPSALSTMARLAMLGGHALQAQNLAVAAAASAGDPAQTWEGLARFAQATGDAPTRRIALRQTLLHSRGLRAPGVREALLLAGLADAALSWGASQTEVGRQTLARHVERYLSQLAPAQVWGGRDRLIWRVAETPSWRRGAGDAAWRELVVDALLGSAHAGEHRLALARVGRTARPTAPSPFDGPALVLAALDGQLGQMPVATGVLGDPVRLTPLRSAIARHGTQWETRWRTAIGLAVFGSARARATGVAALVSMATPKQRAEIVQWVLLLPGAAEPDRVTPRARDAKASTREGSIRPVPLIADEEVLFRLAAGLELAPAWLAG